MESIAITVSKKNLDDALVAVRKGHHTRNCLIAQAFKTAFPKKRVSVSYETASVGTGKRWKDYRLPSKAANLIARFDNDYDEGSKIKRLRASLPVTFNAKLDV